MVNLLRLFIFALIVSSCSSQHSKVPAQLEEESFFHKHEASVIVSLVPTEARLKIWEQRITLSFFEETFGVLPESEAGQQIEKSKKFLSGTNETNIVELSNLGYPPINRPDVKLVSFKPIAGVVQLSPNSDVVRESQRLQICHEVMKEDQHVVYGIHTSLLISLVEAQGLTENAISKRQIRKLFIAFQSGRQPTVQVVDSLALLAEVSLRESEALAIDSWRFVLLALCADPGTQVM